MSIYYCGGCMKEYKNPTQQCSCGCVEFTQNKEWAQASSNPNRPINVFLRNNPDPKPRPCNGPIGKYDKKGNPVG